MDTVEDCISFLLSKAAQRVNQEFKRRLAPHGVTPAQYAVLNILWERAAMSGAQIGERLVLDPATVTGLLDRLELAGLLERRPDPTDRRCQRIHLTKLGRDLEGPLLQVQREVNRDVLRDLEPKQAAQLKTLLAQIGTTSAAPVIGARP